MSCITDCWEFYPGETKTLDICMSQFNSAHDCKEIFPLSTNGARKIEITLPGEPDDLVFDLTTTPALVVVSETLGKLKIDLTSTQTNLLRNGSITVKHDALGDGTDVKIGVAGNIVCKNKVPEC